MKELVDTGRVKGYEGHHINNVAANDISMAEDPANTDFMTRLDHFDAAWGRLGQMKTAGDLIARLGVLPLMQRFDNEERNLTGACPACSSSRSGWSIANPFNNILRWPSRGNREARSAAW